MLLITKLQLNVNNGVTQHIHYLHPLLITAYLPSECLTESRTVCIKSLRVSLSDCVSDCVWLCVWNGVRVNMCVCLGLCVSFLSVWVSLRLSGLLWKLFGIFQQRCEVKFIYFIIIPCVPVCCLFHCGGINLYLCAILVWRSGSFMYGCVCMVIKTLENDTFSHILFPNWCLFSVVLCFQISKAQIAWFSSWLFLPLMLMPF